MTTAALSVRLGRSKRERNLFARFASNLLRATGSFGKQEDTEMDSDSRYGSNPKSTAQIGGHPIHPMLIPFPITCLVGAFVTDLLFLNSGDHGFAVASTWLIGFGIGTALLAAVFGLIDYMGD